MLATIIFETNLDRYNKPGMFPFVPVELCPNQGDMIYVKSEYEAELRRQGFPVRLQVQPRSYHQMGDVLTIRIELYYSKLDLEALQLKGKL